MSGRGQVRYHDVEVHLAGTRVLQEVSLAAAAGSFLGVIGPNGSGKSTLLRCLYRAIRPGSGRVCVDGRDIAAISMRENARQVAALTQAVTGHLDFTVAEVVRTGRLPHRPLLDFGAPGDDSECAQAMADAGVQHLAHRLLGSLSGGEAQRVLIARAFAQQPAVLVLDEPTNHLDVRHQFGVLAAARDRRVTVVAALHDLNLAAQFCDDLVLVAQGRVVAVGSPAQVLTAETVRRWFGVGCHVHRHPRSGVPQIIYDQEVTT